MKLQILMTSPALFAIVTFILAYVVWTIALFLRNRSVVRATGLPYYYFPFSDNKLWYLVIGTAPVVWLIERLPSSLAAFVNCSSYLRRWQSKYIVHEKTADVVFMVSSGPLSCFVADAAVVEEVFANRTKFVKPAWNFDHLRLFGNNVVACDENDWRHHRRFTGPPFNERNNALVWTETINQTSDMLSTWTQSVEAKSDTSTKSNGGKYLDTTKHDFRRLALHVISGAGFGISLPYSGKAKTAQLDQSQAQFADGDPSEGYSFTFREALEYISINLVTVIALLQTFPMAVLRHGPQWMRTPLEVIHDIESYLNSLITIARAGEENHQAPSRSGNLLANVVMGREKAFAETGKSEFSDQDIRGNVFIFSIAGHETTATTMNFAFIMLALHPEAQEWILAKLDEELADESHDPRDWTYNHLFERLVACRCLMFETLRHFPPVPAIPKWTHESQTLTVNGHTHQLPANLWISLNAISLHFNPKYWGANVKDFDPSRWDASNETSFLRSVQTIGENHNAPGLYQPVPGSWIPFSGGPRGCLGKMFAQVEFVACMAIILRKHKVQLALKPGENIRQAKARVQNIIDKSTGLTALTVQEDIGLIFLDR